MSDNPTEPTSKPGDLSSLPEWAREAISRANNEAAERRVSLREKTEENTRLLNQIQELTDGKTTAETAVTTANTELLKLTIALDAGVPGERVRSIAERLRGSNEDELKADATKLIEEFGINQTPTPRATDPSQGRGNDAASLPNTPQAEFAQLFGNLDLFRK